LAAQHELEQGSPSAARNILQQGIRLNNQSIDLWCEYVKMEISWCEIFRRRWDTLGIAQDAIPKDNFGTDELSDDIKETRTQVLNGAIVKEVVTNALKGTLILALLVPKQSELNITRESVFKNLACPLQYPQVL
jgi:U3 small nucleolar RNA-associated protein 6